MEITVTSTEKCDVVAIDGRIDSNTAPDLAEVLNKITEKNRYKIIIDLSWVSFISSAGLRLLIDFQKICKNIDNGEVLLVNIPQRVYETLALAGFLPFFKSYNSINSAIDAF